MSDEPAKFSLTRGWSVRYRLLAIALLPMLVISPLLLAGTIVRWNTKFDALLIAKVNGDLTIAHEYLARILDNTGEKIRALGDSAGLRNVLRGENDTGLSDYLERSRKRLSLDFLYIVEPDGRVVASAPQTFSRAARVDWPIVRTARAMGSHTAIDIFEAKELAAVDPALEKRAYLELVPTPNAVATDRTTETRGMVIQSASLLSFGEAHGGVVVGGTLLNGNLVFIDTINDLVYRDASLPEGSQGTATLFLDDVRITTNVRLFEGKRALGTRVSHAVRAAVLDEGKVWLDRAFVVNDWYISAYEPIVDSAGKRVGMLYVGFLEAPFIRNRIVTFMTIGAAFVAIAAVTVPIFLGWARSIFEPLGVVTRTIAKVEEGDLTARTSIKTGDDEIGRVALHLDKLLDQIQERDRELRDWNTELNKRVDERTRELQLANLKIEAATKQLVLSEKLAAIGEITAGVAHEINNPIAVMQGNLEVARNLIGRHADVASPELNLIDEQIRRISEIVMKLLQFARPEEYAGFVERHEPARIISDSFPLVQHLLNKSNVRVSRQDHGTRFVVMNRTELQQVLVNLIVNAVHAMPNGGALTLKTFDKDVDDKPGIAIEVADTGSGMTEDVMAKIFDPFFTTKDRQGTGLGLSISQKLVARQGGRISVESKLGKGTTFTVWLPEAPSE
jgi:two-component system NtrC family sensor kinase